MRSITAFLFAVALLAHAPTAIAQIAGVPVSCADFRGVAVALSDAPGLPDVGAARVVNGQPVIFLNSRVLSQQPPEMQLFWYAHECAHHALGHLASVHPFNEAAADCWAVRTGRQQGWFPPYAFQGLIAVLGRSPGSVWGHLPGPQRIANMQSCYTAP